MIEIKNLNKSYSVKGVKHKILHNINLTVHQGEIFGIIGKSGAGKSTLLKMFNLLDAPDSGEIYINGVNIVNCTDGKLRSIRKQIGVVFQGFNLLSSKTVFDNIALSMIFHKTYTKEEIHTRVNELLHLVGLYQMKDKYPSALSGGQKQRVGIARALATNPHVLLCDEATSALDTQTTSSILELLLTINKQLNITIVIITHELEVVRKICDKVAVIDGGSIIEQGKTLDIILHPKKEITRKLILEEEVDKYLSDVMDFYKFHKTDNTHLILVSFIGQTTFEPFLSKISLDSGVLFSILKGELGRIKYMPFGQLLLEMNGDIHQVNKAFTLLKNSNIHYEIIS